MEGGLAISCFTHARAGVNLWASALTAPALALVSTTGDDAGDVAWESSSNAVPQQITICKGSQGDIHRHFGHVNSG